MNEYTVEVSVFAEAENPEGAIAVAKDMIAEGDYELDSIRIFDSEGSEIR